MKFQVTKGRRHVWCRLHVGFANDPKWKAVARLSGARLCDILGVVLCLMEEAAKHRPSGCVEDFSVLETAVTLDLDREMVIKIVDTLYEIGWLDQAWIATWDRNQYRSDDLTAADRAARYRARKKLQQNQFASRRDVTSDADKYLLSFRERRALEKKEATVVELGAGTRFKNRDQWLEQHRLEKEKSDD